MLLQLTTSATAVLLMPTGEDASSLRQPPSGSVTWVLPLPPASPSLAQVRSSTMVAARSMLAVLPIRSTTSTLCQSRIRRTVLKSLCPPEASALATAKVELPVHLRLPLPLLHRSSPQRLRSRLTRRSRLKSRLLRPRRLSPSRGAPLRSPRQPPLLLSG